MAKKRANGDGNLRQRPNGLWELTMMVGYQPDGRRKTKSFYGKTQKEAKAKANAYMIDKAQGFSRAFGTGHSDPEPPDGQRGKIIPFPMVG